MIGVFDSGLGGLTALCELAELMPGEDFVYFGDTGRVPYGSKSADTIIRYSEEIMRFLLGFGIRAALVACGTASSAALPTLRRKFALPIFGVIDAAAEAAVRTTKNGRVGVIGTSTTIRLGAFAQKINELDPKIEVSSVACPLFVHLVEDGFTAPGDPVTLAAAERYLSPLRTAGIDTLVLGCTHYPIISGAIAAALPGVTLISSGKAAADMLASALKEDISPGKKGTIRCFVSDTPESFESAARVFMGDIPLGSAEFVDISKY